MGSLWKLEKARTWVPPWSPREGSQPCRHLDFLAQGDVRLPARRTVRGRVCSLRPPGLWSLVTAAPGGREWQPHGLSGRLASPPTSSLLPPPTSCSWTHLKSSPFPSDSSQFCGLPGAPLSCCPHLIPEPLDVPATAEVWMDRMGLALLRSGVKVSCGRENEGLAGGPR